MLINEYVPTLAGTDIQGLVQTLQAGGLALFPSDTVWALGCDATQPEAIQRLYRLKNRTRQQPFILLVDSIAMLKEYVPHVHPRIETLLYFHNRPLTVIYEEAVNLPQEALALDGAVAIRVVHDEFCRAFIRSLGKPVVGATACKEPGRIPQYFGEIQSDIIEQADYVVKYRQKERLQEGLSVIARLDPQEELEFLRE
jgi:L-threonylcarbamoyladenylate synthase